MILAASANNAAKGVIAWALGGRALGLRVGMVLFASSGIGVAAALPLLTANVAAFAMILAASANNAAKGVIAWALGGRALGLRVGMVLFASSGIGVAAALPLLTA